MQFNSNAQGAANYLVQAGMAPDMTMTGTFNPVQQIGTTQNANSSMAQGSMKATGALGQAINEARAIREAGKYNAMLQRSTDSAEADTRIAGAIFGGIQQLGGAAIGAFGNTNSYYGSGSTGGAGDTVRAGATGKYGSFQDPTADINRALGGSKWGVYQ